MKYFYSFFGIIFQCYFYFFLIEAAQYECLYRRTAHHATAVIDMPKQNFQNPEFGNKFQTEVPLFLKRPEFLYNTL